MKKTLIPCFFLALFAATSAMAAQGRGVEARLQEVQRIMDGVSQISGTFTQQKKLEFLNEPVVSDGRFYFAKPGSLTWEYVSPAPSGLKVENGKATVWNGPPGARVTQPGAMSRAAKMMADQVMMWMNFKPREILAMYDVRVMGESPLTFEVVPKREGLRKYLKSITVVLGDDIRVVRNVILEESEATTTLTFDAIQFDSGPPQGMIE